MTSAYRVLYCSRQCLTGTDEEVDRQIAEILAVSRRNNARDGVTGALLYSRGCFAQVLEGRLADIERVFERIGRDERHRDLTVVSFGPVSTCEFGDWSMAYDPAPQHGSERLAAVTGAAIDAAFAGRTQGGTELLMIMRGIMVREHEWAN